MADENVGLTLPTNSIWSEWSFGQVVLALTGDSIDLDTAANATWFQVNTEPGESDQISYHAYEKYYYGVNYNDKAFKAWDDAVTRMNEVMVNLPSGRRGALDLPTLYEVAELIDRYTRWTDTAANDFRAWATNLDRDDSAFSGKAASIIQRLMADNAQMLEGMRKQLIAGRQVAMSKALFDLYETMLYGVKALASAWQEIGPKIADAVVETTKRLVINDIHQYLGINGILLDPEFADVYKLDKLAGPGGLYVDKAKEYIELVMSSYRDGDLRQATTWDTLGSHISDQITPYLEALDAQARRVMTQIEPVLATATSALMALTAEAGDGTSGSTTTPPPEVPTIDLTGLDGTDLTGLDDTELPDLTGADDTATPDLPGIENTATDVPGLSDPGSSTVDVPDTTGLDAPATGDASLTDPGLTDPGLTDLAAGNSDVTAPPDGTTGLDSGLTADGTSGVVLPPTGLTGTGTSADDQERDATGITTPFAGGALPPDDLGGGLGAGGSGSDSAGIVPDDLATSAFGGSDDGFGTPGGSTGGAGGFGSTTTPGQSGGFVGAGAGTANLPTSQLAGTPMGAGTGMGGMPMGMPMGMGGMGQNDQNKDRERQTWLAEDESVWGTGRGSGIGVIGRVDEDDDAEEFVVLAGPVARVRRPAKPDAAVERSAEQQSGA